MKGLTDYLLDVASVCLVAYDKPPVFFLNKYHMNEKPRKVSENFDTKYNLEGIEKLRRIWNNRHSGAHITLVSRSLIARWQKKSLSPSPPPPLFQRNYKIWLKDYFSWLYARHQGERDILNCSVGGLNFGIRATKQSHPWKKIEKKKEKRT